MTVSFVVAAADNGVIGQRGGGLPWQQSADLQHFRRLTEGQPIIMGRKTQQELKAPLPNRRNIVITRDNDYNAAGYVITHSLKAALKEVEQAGADEALIIGGGQIFDMAMPVANKIYLTEIHASPEGEAYFRYDPKEWREVSREDHPADADNQYPYSFVTLVRAA